MTYALTSDQQADIRADLGGETKFTNAQLDRLFDRANGDYNVTVVYALRQLLADVKRDAVYTVGLDGVNKDKRFQNIKDLLTLWEDIAGTQGGELESGVMSLGLDMTSDTLTTFGDTE